MKKEKTRKKASEIHGYRDLDSQKELFSAEPDVPQSVQPPLRQRCLRPRPVNARFVSTSSKDASGTLKRK